MIQFNLLPDVKLEYIRANRTKRLVMLVAGSVTAVSVGMFLLLFFSVNVLQKQHLKNLTNDINRDSKQLQEIKDLDKILTIQNQLSKLTELHDAKVYTSRMKEYITQVTPQNVSFAEVEVKLTEGTMRFKGSADTLRTVNQFVDTLKFTKYRTLIDDGEGGSKYSEEKNAFSEVVLFDFGRDDKGASYEITLKYDPAIFTGVNFVEEKEDGDNEGEKPVKKNPVQLIVPNIITTRSVTEKPDFNLFLPLSDSEGEE